MRTRFRGIDVREGVLLRGDAGWGSGARSWSTRPRSPSRGCAAPRRRRPATGRTPVRDVGAGQRDRAGGRRRAGARDRARRRLHDRQGQGRRARADPRRRPGPGRGGPRRPRRRRAGSGSTPTAAGRSTRRSPRSGALDRAAGGLEYVEQPCATVEELAAVRRAVDVPIAADESIRRAADPYRVRDLEAADVAVLKVQPLGGVRACLRIAEDIGLPVVVSSALETSVGIAAGVALAAALPELPYACGLATVQLLTDDVVAEPLLPVDGALPVASGRGRRGGARPAGRRARAGGGVGGPAGRGAGGAAGSRLVTNPVDRAGPRGGRARWSAAGSREVVLAPGSRNAPLAFAAYDAAEAGLLRLHTRIDERTAGFLALGLTKVGVARRGDVHVRHRRRQPAPGRARGGARRRPARRRHRRPAGPAARHRRQPDHRPGRHLRAAGRDGRRGDVPPRSPISRRAPSVRAPQRPARRPAGPRRPVGIREPVALGHNPQ